MDRRAQTGERDGVTFAVRTFEEAGQTLVLRDLGTHHELLLGQIPLLSSAALATERAFGELARVLAPPGPPRRILVGGLGFGATARGVLDSAATNAEVIVVEKLQTVIDLVRGELGHLAPGVLEDPRVRLVRADVVDVLEGERDLDAILLDVDNGPGWASFRSNARIYGTSGLASARAALAPSGAFAVWSGYPAEAFVGALRRAGLRPSVVSLDERGHGRARAYVGAVPPFRDVGAGEPPS